MSTIFNLTAVRLCAASPGVCKFNSVGIDAPAKSQSSVTLGAAIVAS